MTAAAYAPDQPERPSSDLAPAIVVLNEKYLPDVARSAARVGATSFALDVMACFSDASIFAGAILYRRQPGLAEPTVRAVVRGGVPCVQLSFEFSMEAAAVRQAISDSVEQLMRGRPAAVAPMLYYQTDTLLVFHPPRLAACVTHHAPFVDDFREHYPEGAAESAFGDTAKSVHLARYQEDGIRVLTASANIFVIQHSRVQRDYLLRRGVDRARIREVPPPLPDHDPVDRPLPEPLASFVASADLLVYTAVARLDYFKNVDMLLSSGELLMDRGLPVRILVVGGGSEDSPSRERLSRSLLPARSRQVLAVERLPKDDLYRLFQQTTEKGVFVCSSRYETLGITPLEAARHGVATVISGAPTVEAGRFFPQELRFAPTAAALADTVEGVVRAGPALIGAQLRFSISHLTSRQKFREEFLQAWQHFTTMARATAPDLTDAPGPPVATYS